MGIVVIYHNHCMDGQGAAYAAWKHFVQDKKRTDVVFKAWMHKDPPPTKELVEGNEVYVVDFCFNYQVLLQIAGWASRLTILDHHKTSEEDVTGKVFPDNVEIVFDMTRSGAGITWDYFHKDQSRLKLIDYIEDADLFRFALPQSKIISLCTSMLDKEFESYERYAMQLEQEFHQVVLRGSAMAELQDRNIAQGAKKFFVKKIRFDGKEYTVALTNTGTMVSLVLNQILIDHPEIDFACSYVDENETERRWSVRSRPKKEPGTKVDIDKFVRQYGGGGHSTAAGFNSSTNFMIS